MNQQAIFCKTLLVLCLFYYPQVWGQTLQENFNTPPTSALPKAYWVFVNGNYDLSQMSRELKEFKEIGMGGLDIWDVAGWVDPNGVVPAGPSFMGDASLEAIAHGIREGHRLGLEMGLTISSSWNAGGDWVPYSDGVVGLFHSTVTVKGPKRHNDMLPFPKIPLKSEAGTPMLLDIDSLGVPKHYQEEAVLAIPVLSDNAMVPMEKILDVSEYMQNGRLQWQVPKGIWKIVRYVSTQTGQPLKRPSPNSNGLMIDHFNAGAQERNLDFIFARLESALGPLRDSGLAYLYTDSYEANSATWTVGMKREFLKRNHYDMTPFLPFLSAGFKGDETIRKRFTYDFNKTLSDLIIENHYALGTKRCREKGIGFIAEAGGPGPPLHNTPFESLGALGSLTVPRGEFWFDPSRTIDFINRLQIVKGPASAAHIYGQSRVEAEAFTGTQLWQHGPGKLKSAADRALCEGLTSFVYHTTPHMPPAGGYPGWVYNFGTLMNSSRVWWSMSKNFHTYLGRCSYMLKQGTFVGDVLYYYGDKAPNFVNLDRIENLLGFGYDYDAINTDVLLNTLKVENGMYVLPNGQRYRLLVLSNDEAISPNILLKIEQLVKNGGTIWGKPPKTSNGLYKSEENDSTVQRLAKILWPTNAKKHLHHEGTVYSSKISVKQALKDMKIVPDVDSNLELQSEKIDYIHRATDSADIYFVRNKTHTPLSFELTLRSSKGSPEHWNPLNGMSEKYTIFSQKEGRTSLPMNLNPEESTFIVFKNQVSRKVVRTKRNGKLLFPNTKTPSGIQSSGDYWIFDLNGTYEVLYEDNHSQSFKVDSALVVKTLNDPWKVRFPHGQDAPLSIVFDSLHSWSNSSNEGIRHFSGIATYENIFYLKSKEIDERAVFLDLGKVKEVARVYVNGLMVDILWHAPYRLDISKFVKSGRNSLTIEVANVLHNRLVGDAKRPSSEKRLHTNITKGPNAWTTLFEQLPLKESGLLGPVGIWLKKRRLK